MNQVERIIVGFLILTMDSTLDLECVIMLRWDREMTLLLQALYCLVKTLLHWCELQTQLLQLLVRELVWLLPWIHLIRAPKFWPHKK